MRFKKKFRQKTETKESGGVREAPRDGDIES